MYDEGAGEERWWPDRPSHQRGQPVNIHVTEFNFINYTISYKVEETVVEAYVMLEKLWQQLPGIPLFGAGGP